MITVLIASCSQSATPPPTSPAADVIPKPKPVAEVSPPLVVQQLHQSLDRYHPQVSLSGVRSQEIVQNNTISIQFQVQDLPVFQDKNSGLGPHLKVILDDQLPQAIYDTTQPLTLSDLEAGTHTLRVFAVYPWGESFKNDGAYAQTTFHVFTKTPTNHPDLGLPLLTYNEPQGIYGSEPVILDFYLTNAPLHVVAQVDPDDTVRDWRIQATVNGESFIIDQWQPLYLKGIQPGKNWIQLEFLDELGEPLNNVYNNTARVFTYDPKATDMRSRLLRGELSVTQARSIVDPGYIPGTPIPEPESATPSEPDTESDIESKVESEVEPAPTPPQSDIPSDSSSERSSEDSASEATLEPEQTSQTSESQDTESARIESAENDQANQSQDLEEQPDQDIEPPRTGEIDQVPASEPTQPEEVKGQSSTSDQSVAPNQVRETLEDVQEKANSVKSTDESDMESTLTFDESLEFPALESGESEIDLAPVPEEPPAASGSFEPSVPANTELMQELTEPLGEEMPHLPRVKGLPELPTESSPVSKATQFFKGLFNRLP
ncbi:MAG: hypothetical protein HC835_20205 [Oscillatoriales cyanobacterium RM2_1_1]|nr:hypothetical protein [Oscillatoriales cyanobacterium SM2_3_0]NJO47731.1 hypothetical protein [Oscillatoriales cyanobacterium RM2_1_1]